MIDLQHQLAIQDLNARYVAAIDDDRLEKWPEFFIEDGRYRVTTSENVEQGFPIGMIYATSRAMLVDRVMALRKANIYEPQRYRHMIGAIKIAAEDQGVVPVVANLIVVRTMQDGAMSLFAAGRYVDRVVRQGRGWKFAAKEVVLDSRQIDTLLAIPL